MNVIQYILSIIVGIQVFYYLFFYSRILFFKILPKSKASFKEGISIVVCAHNELENLKVIVPKLLQQNFHRYEIIILDDRSTDGTSPYFKELYANEKKINFHKIESTPSSFNAKKYALTEGIKRTQYDWVLLTDADCLPVSNNWISAMTAQVKNGIELVLGYSPYAFRKGFLNQMIRFETIHTAMQYFSFALAKVPYMGVGRNVLYKKALFERNNGLETHKSVLGGDDDLFIRDVANGTNVGICLNKESWMMSKPKETLSSWYRQKRRHLSVGVYYKWKTKIFLGLSLVSHILFYPLVVALMVYNVQAAILFLMIRSLVFVLIFILIARKLEDNYLSGWLLLFVDLVYIFNYLLITTSLMLHKKVKWN